ncbi:RNA polymerase sigma factor [Cyclobacterium plantarum]|uniref:Sigma-70 family RNA polymerase sigma factor n=1 Tax=Cyclobacterium plantarum TaxID=2716263 RepID=A0ABX0H8S9_9BACT|nr:sigma-70 family RNA polymerase sigma factor [Cyclobacterium plantarum]NHE58266.1 sigma-70 family RNA polymerase sigma factor [Cyclobacterium plantarum]
MNKPKNYTDPNQGKHNNLRNSELAVNEKDADLWIQFKQGSETAFIKIYERYYDQLFNYGLRLSGQPQLTEDCIQDLFIQIRLKRSGLGDTDSIKFYLMKCLKRKLIREMGKSKKTVAFKDHEPFQIIYSHEQVMIDQQFHEEQANQLNQALKKLSGRKKEALYYFYFEGLPYHQISELMGFSHVKSARNLIYQAISTLKLVLQ